MSTRQAEGIVDGALERIASEGGFVEFVQNAVLGGIVYAFALNVIDGIGAIGGLFIQIPLAIVEGFVGLFDSTFGGFIQMLDASTDFAVVSLWEGTATILGPFQPLLVIAIVFAATYLVMTFMDWMDFSPIAILRGVRR